MFAFTDVLLQLYAVDVDDGLGVLVPEEHVAAVRTRHDVLAARAIEVDAFDW